MTATLLQGQPANPSASSTSSSSTSSSSTSSQWAAYFTANNQRWQTFAQTLNTQTLQLEPEFIRSIQIFQLGEQSEGRTLMALATAYAKQQNDPDYVSAIQQFIKEEQRHAYFMALALQTSYVQPIEKQWSDELFRKLRKLCGLEMMISVLLTAEVIAIAYYSTLAQACQNPQAQKLFERILQDEATHLKFHGEHLRNIRSGPDSIGWALHRLLLSIVATLVWIEHRAVLHHQFSTFGQFLQRCDTLLMNLAQ